MITLIRNDRQTRLVYLRDLMRELILRDMKLRYKRSLMGIAWSLLNPLAQLLVLNLVFRLVLPLDIPDYTAFLFTGLLAWNWFQSGLYSATGAIVDNRDLVRQPGFPAAILPVVSVSVHLIHYLLALPVLLAFLLFTGVNFAWTLVLLPLLLAVQFLVTLSLGYFIATLQVAFRDVQYLLGVALLLGFYLSPVFYDVRLIPARYQALYSLNPMTILLESYRAILIRGDLPGVGALLVLLALALILLWTGYRIFGRASHSFAEEL